jgi:Raf kinase inhibitor-like YbhB/YbcL family protein
LISGFLLTACKFGNSPDNRTKQPQRQSTQLQFQLQLKSPDLEAKAFIPRQFTCDGANQSPDLSWTAPPQGTQSWALFLTSEIKTHWVIYDLPLDQRSLPAAIPNQPFLTQGGIQAKNDFGSYGYQGPCTDAPTGTATSKATSSYVFKLYAVDTILDLPPGTTAPEVQTALQNHILTTASLTVRY